MRRRNVDLSYYESHEEITRNNNNKNLRRTKIYNYVTIAILIQFFTIAIIL